MIRIKPVTAPPASQITDTTPYQSNRRLKNMAGASTASKMAALVRNAIGERVIYRSRAAGPSVKALWLNASTVNVTARARRTSYRKIRNSRRAPVFRAFSEYFKRISFFQVPDYSLSVHSVPVVFLQILLSKSKIFLETLNGSILLFGHTMYVYKKRPRYF